MLMPKLKTDKAREQRIAMEIVADCHDESEQMMGWYNYLEEQLRFPFIAQCIAKREISPLRVKDEVEVIGMVSENECRHEIFVRMRWERDGLGVPLSQLKPSSHADKQTMQAVEDWHYWVKQGHQFQC
jgi:hypothetical protein